MAAAVALGLFLVALLVQALCRVVYNVFFHPLRKFPGPWMAGATAGWRAYKEIVQKRTVAREYFELHEKYGEIIRVAPNELHFGNPSAFREIYHGSNRWDKDANLYHSSGVTTGSFMISKYTQAKQRRDQLAPIFNKKGIDEFEETVWRNTTKLASHIASAGASNTSIDLLYAFKSLSLDTIMCLAFGDCIDAVQAPGFRDPLVVAMDGMIGTIPIMKHFPAIRNLKKSVLPAAIMSLIPSVNKVMSRIYLAHSLIQRQLRQMLGCASEMDIASQRPTLFHRMLDLKSYWEGQGEVPDLTELYDEGFTLLFAGVTTVSDALLLGHWHLMRRQSFLSQLRSEIITAWPDLDSPPSLATLERLPILTAAIKEALRFIPLSRSFTRILPAGGATISGHHIPGGTAVGMSILHVHQCAAVWGEDVGEFRPERWLDGGAKGLDRWLVAFGRGPRMCFGMRLAWAEMYIGFATMIRRFDMTIDGTTPEDMEWRECIAAHFPRRHLHAWCRPLES